MELSDWLFRVVPHDEESLGHFLGRFRRANELSDKAIADHLGIRVEWVQAWETPSRRRNPTPLQQIALAKLMDVDPEHLVKMLPPSNLHLQTRLCPTCYEEVEVHRITWQQKGVEVCDRHNLPLLSACPICQTGFRTPARWSEGCCERCKLAFTQMQSPT
ncbi:helix-turn-helix domain-containing protein [bacterium]|nr:helix-turn-helix domain-containing protein [bacterium]